MFQTVAYSEATVDLIWKVLPKTVKRLDRDLQHRLSADLVASLDDPELKELVLEFRYEFARMEKGDYLPFHTEESRISPIEVVMWFPDGPFEGRDFVYYLEGKECRIKPTHGLTCFMYTQDPMCGHKVDELLSDSKVITITGGLGGKYDTDVSGYSGSKRPDGFKEVHLERKGKLD